MKKFSAVIAICGLLFAANLANADHPDGTDAIIGTYPVGGGLITITPDGHDVVTPGIELASSGGNLVPSNPDDASPFLFFLSNTSTSVVYAQVPLPVTLAADVPVTLATGYNGPGGDDLVSNYGVGNTGVSAAFPITLVPEPATGLLAALGGLGLLAFRRRR